MENFTEFMRHMKTKTVPRGYHLISFDVISLFTNVPLDATAGIQKDGVAMGSPLAPVLAGIFMVELERAVIPKLSRHLQFWKSYVNDIICFVCKGYQEFALSRLNSFHNSIQFTYKIKNRNEVSFLDT